MGTEMDPGSYDDDVAQQRDALQASVDATVEVLLGGPVDEVERHLQEQFASRGLNTRPDEVHDLASMISAGEHPVYGASFVEEIRTEDTEGGGSELVFPPRRIPWGRWLRGDSHPTMRPELDDSWYHPHLDWPEGLDPRQAFVHSGMYVGWLITRGLVREYVFRGAHGEEVLRGFRAREVTGPELYEQWFGGRLRAPMLTEEGERFTRDYYLPDAGPFMKDFQRLFTMELPSFYSAEDSWSNFDRLSTMLDQRYRQWHTMPNRRLPLRRRWGPTPS